MSHSDLQLINLEAQKDAVRKHVKGWSKSQILSWLRKFGTVIEAGETSVPNVYVFESKTGSKTAFTFSNDEEITIVSSGWLT